MMLVQNMRQYDPAIARDSVSLKRKMDDILKNIIKSELINAQKRINTKKIRKGQLDTIFYTTPILLLA